MKMAPKADPVAALRALVVANTDKLLEGFKDHFEEMQRRIDELNRNSASTWRS